MWTKGSVVSVQIPKFLETISSSCKVSSKLPSLTDSDFHQPCCLNNLSFTPALPAADVPPNRKLCREKGYAFIPTS